MEAPPLSTPPPTTPTTPTPPGLYPNSVDFSNKNDSFDVDPTLPPKLRLMCSYGGRIVPRPHDRTLCYVGGDTRIIGIDRHTSLSDLHRRLSKSLFNNQPFSLKYQLPSEDLDSLITVTSDEDLENMVEEYDRLNNAGGALNLGRRLRLFLFPKSSSSIEQLIETVSTKSEEWFYDALNGKASAVFGAASDRGFSESSSLNCLLGLDDEFVEKAVVAEKDVEAQIEGSKSANANGGNVNGNYGINHGLNSVPDSPMIETTSSFGSSSGSPTLANLPPIRVHVDENPKLGPLGIEEKFQQMIVGVIGNINPPPSPPLPTKQEELGVFMSAGLVVSGLPAVVGGEYSNRVIPDDERPDQNGHRKLQQIPQFQLQPKQIAQFQQKQADNLDLASPDSVASDGGLTNPLSRQRQTIYQEPPSGHSRNPSNQVDLKVVDQSNSKVQMQPQIQESSYTVTSQYDQNQPQLQKQQQFLLPPNHYTPSGAVPMYYSVYPSQQHRHPHQSVVDQHYPVYIVQAHAPSSLSQTPPPATLTPLPAYNQNRSAPSKAEMANGAYRTAAPQLVQVPSNQHQPQYVGFSPVHHPSSAPNSAYAYEYADPTHPQMYYTPLPPQLAAQFQSLTSAPNTFSQFPAENNKQQGRNSQP